jgi:hypothetical protein
MTKQIAVQGGDVDKLGVLLAQISDLTAQAKKIKDALKKSGVDSMDGALFRATVVTQEKTTYDVDVLKTAADKATLELAMRESVCVQVRVTSRGE